MKQFLQAAVAATLLAGSAAALAAQVSFTGNLAGDNAVALFSFTLDADADVSLRTLSYGGGTNAAGSAIAAGGFDPTVALFFGTGDAALLLRILDDGGASVATDPVTGSALDDLLDGFALQAGTYSVALTQFDNSARGPMLGDGFIGYSNASGFNGRSSAWALDLLGVSRAAAVPEPQAWALVGLGLAALAATRRRNTAGQRSRARPLASATP